MEQFTTALGYFCHQRFSCLIRETQELSSSRIKLTCALFLFFFLVSRSRIQIAPASMGCASGEGMYCMAALNVSTSTAIMTSRLRILQRNTNEVHLRQTLCEYFKGSRMHRRRFQCRSKRKANCLCRSRFTVSV